jgi:hypothetical protein
MVAIELSIRGTFLGLLETPAGMVQPTGAKIDAPGADFWYLHDGKIERFDCFWSTPFTLKWASCPTSYRRLPGPWLNSSARRGFVIRCEISGRAPASF